MAPLGTYPTFIAAGLVIGWFWACSPDPGQADGVPLFGSNGGQAGHSSDASLGTSATGNLGAGGGGPIFGDGARHPIVPVLGADGACFAASQAPEQIIVYRDASVTDTLTDTLTDTTTDTITTYKPVALFVMQDRTGSMVSGFPSGCACSWGNSTAALQSFVNDPRSAGLDVGLGFFGGSDKTQCDGSDCGQPVVPIGPIAQTGPQIVSAMNNNAPNPLNITPLECGLRGMVNACLQFMAQSPIGEQCVVVLVTDGNTQDPTPCNPDVPTLVQIVADGHSKGVTVYTLGLQGSDPNLLNQLAQAGGTNSEIDVAAGQQAFFDALNNIRQKVTVTTSHTTHSTTSSRVSTSVTTQTVVSTPLSCQWKIPPAPMGQTFDPAKVNLQLTPPGGQPTQFGHLESDQDCARAGEGWYYDDPSQPTQVLVCPQTCDVIKGSTGARIDILFGCATIPVIFH